MTDALPDNWEIWPLANVGEWSGGGTPTSTVDAYWDGDIPWVTPKDMKTRRIASSQDKITPIAVAHSAAKLIEAGSVLFVTRSGILAHSFPVATTSVQTTTNQDLKAITPIEVIDADYLAWVLRAFERTVLRSCTKHGTTVHSIEMPALKRLGVPVPPPNEQRRIVAKIEELFSELDKGVEALATAREQVAAYRQAVLKSAFAGKLAGGEVGSWAECTVGQLVTDVRYGTAKKCAVDQTKTPVLRIPNVASGRIDLSDLKHTDFDEDEMEKLRLEAGDILIVRSNGSASLVGLSAVVTEEAAGYAYAGYLIRLRLKRDTILPQFLNLYLHSPWVRAGIERQARSSSGVHNVNSDEIRAIALRVPSLPEQERIVSVVGGLLSRIEDIQACAETEVKRGNALRQAILQRAFSGQLVGQDPKDEPASVLLERIRAGREDEAPKRDRKLKNGKKEAA